MAPAFVNEICIPKSTDYFLPGTFGGPDRVGLSKTHPKKGIKRDYLDEFRHSGVIVGHPWGDFGQGPP